MRDDGMTMPEPAEPSADLLADLDGIEVRVDPSTRRVKSRDFFWFSPVLKPQLEDKLADFVIRPATKAELIRATAVCARHRMSVTVRGGGTGNYGQAVPLEGGAVMDMSRLDRILWAKPAVGRFEAGARLLDIDKALRPDRWELRFFPSTRRLATIGGFVAGGAAGIGSCTWGQNADAGNVVAAEILTVEEEPRLLELRGSDVLKVLHAYGVNGIITEVEIPLAPWQPWAERIAGFPTLAQAARFAYALTAAEGIAKKLVSVHDGRIPPLLRRLRPHVPEGHAMAILMICEPQVPAVAELAAEHGGRFVYARGPEAAESAAFDGGGDMPPLYEFTWNHTTLHALKAEPGITYLQVRFPAAREIELIEAMQERFGDELLLHMEFQRRFGRVFVSSLPLVRYTSDERLGELISLIEAMGAQISNPHTYLLDNAGWKRTGAPQAEFKRLADPFRLLNPGKIVESAPEHAEADL
jgi:FAD/FMN-containing dehydrogenase